MNTNIGHFKCYSSGTFITIWKLKSFELIIFLNKICNFAQVKQNMYVDISHKI